MKRYIVFTGLVIGATIMAVGDKLAWKK